MLLCAFGHPLQLSNCTMYIIIDTPILLYPVSTCCPSVWYNKVIANQRRNMA